MNDPIEELKSVVRGEVLADEKSLAHYAKDGSVFRVMPSAVLLPKDRGDIAAVVKWLAEKKEKDPTNPKLSVTCRGKATDQAGGPLNEGIIIRFPGYLDKVLEVGYDFVTVEPGAVFGAINQELAKKKRFLPPYPASAAFSTIGGSVANNGSGEKSLKYGPIRYYLRYIKMVIETGAEITISPLNYADLQLKKQQMNFEGDIYRSLEDLIKKYKPILESSRLKISKNSSGYNLWDADRQTEEGRIFDLQQLIAGSQGTLGIITEISLWTIPKPSHTGLLLGFFDNLPKSGQATAKLLAFEPSALEMVDRFLLTLAKEEKPEMLTGLLPDKMPEVVLLCEFDGDDLEEIKKKIDSAHSAFSGLAYSAKVSLEPEEQGRLWQIRRSAALVAEGARGKKKALPFIEDAVVPPDKFPEYVSRLYEIMRRENLEFSVWGHAGQGNIHIQPFLDIADSNDRELLFKIADEVYQIVAELGGALSGEHNDGIMRTPYLNKIYSPDILKAFREVKKIFDPLNIFNPGKKVELTMDYAKSHLRDEYEVGPPPAKTGEARLVT